MADDVRGARVVLATQNAGKVRELQAMLRDAGLTDPGIVVDARTAGLSDVVETGVTFQENALLKARTAAAETGLIALADDSGLRVDVMGGAPGIFSARWSGVHGDDAANLQLLLAQLGDIAPENRRGSFLCAAAVVAPDGAEHVVTGELPGTILREPAGENGFGYDPIFAPDGQDGLSCAQLSPEHKNRISHRAQAMAAVLPHLLQLLTGSSGTARQDGPEAAVASPLEPEPED